MKIAIIGASGWVGGAIAAEALLRGHEVTAVSRDPSRLKDLHDAEGCLTSQPAWPVGLMRISLRETRCG